MKSRTLVSCVLVACSALLATGPLTPLPDATAATTAMLRKVEREGSCKQGRGDWELSVERRGRRLRIEFEVDDVARRQRWQVFLSNKGRRIAAVTRSSGVSGKVRVHRLTPNRRGRDRIGATAVNTRTGNTCSGRVRF